jgi:hypothetical protein
LRQLFKDKDPNEPLLPCPTKPNPGGNELVEMIGIGVASVVYGLMGFVFFGTLVYGAAILFFRHAFGVELPNPFSWLGLAR